jgi:hypothetical protein
MQEVVGLAEIVLHALRQTRLQTLSIGVRRARMPTHAAADASGHAVKRRSSLGSICTAPPHTHKPHIYVHARACSRPLVGKPFSIFCHITARTHMCTHAASLWQSARRSQRGPTRTRGFMRRSGLDVRQANNPFKCLRACIHVELVERARARKRNGYELVRNNTTTQHTSCRPRERTE